MVALTVAIAVILAGGAIYLATARSPARHAAEHHTSTKNQGPVMLGAGKTGSRSAIPWSLVKADWTLAEVSSAPAGTSQPGAITTYLVDPEGGRYRIQTSSPGVAPQLLAWSGDASNALLAIPSGTSGASYELLSLKTGDITSLQLPTSVTAVGFTRPYGENILAVRQNPGAFRLQRYDLHGVFQATIGSLPRKPGSPEWLPGCGTACGALSSPQGLTVVWGVSGDEMQVVGNAPGGKVTKLSVPGAGSCVPLAWRDDTTVLASCGVTGQPSASQLWLVPTDGSTGPTPVTNPSGDPTGGGVVTGAWQGPGGTVYATMTSTATCPGASSGPGGLSVVPVSSASLQQPMTVQGATNNHTSIVSVSAGRLLLLAQIGCPGTSSLLWLDPSTGATTPVLTGQAGQVGVLAAVPYGGLAPTATNGQ
jgi:hypothetical protein